MGGLFEVTTRPGKKHGSYGCVPSAALSFRSRGNDFATGALLKADDCWCPHDLARDPGVVLWLTR
jgi:hypothetical protein